MAAFHPAALPGFHAETGPDAGPVRLRTWGLSPLGGPDAHTLVLSRVVRRADGAVDDASLVEDLASDPARLTRLLPPFAAARVTPERVTMVADSMGFRHLFHTTPGSAVAAVSSSALATGWASGADLDETAVAVQSLLGWQLGQRSLFDGIRKLEPNAVAHLTADGVAVDLPSADRREPVSLERAVVEAAALLRTSLEALLDDHPDAVLQLTGGMDSRLLLSAIPESRRRGLRAMTLEVPGTGDVAIARQLSARYGIRHEVHGLTAVGGLEPKQAWGRVVADSVRLDAMSDPVALAAQRIAESAFDQGVRISGLGGEIARGFYYLGRVRDRGWSRADVERLAGWRMFVNEAVEPGLLTEEFARWARDAANAEVHAAMTAGGPEWFRAADELYVRHRMQRWAGATDTAVSDQRVVVNPMLDPGFLDLAARLTPQDKAGQRFLAALQVELDPELARVPLDGRPAPIAYAHPSRWQPAVDALSIARRAARKGLQKVQRGNRPPAGGDVLAAKVVAHWRERPEVLAPLAGVAGHDPAWVTAVVAGRVDPRPSSVAFVTNLLVALGATPQGA